MAIPALFAVNIKAYSDLRTLENTQTATEFQNYKAQEDRQYQLWEKFRKGELPASIFTKLVLMDDERRNQPTLDFYLHPLPKVIENGTPLATLETIEEDGLSGNTANLINYNLGRAIADANPNRASLIKYLFAENDPNNSFIRVIETYQHKQIQTEDFHQLRSKVRNPNRISSSTSSDYPNQVNVRVIKYTWVVYSKLEGRDKAEFQEWLKINPEVSGILEGEQNNFTPEGYRDTAFEALSDKQIDLLKEAHSAYNKANPNNIISLRMFKREVLRFLHERDLQREQSEQS